MLTSGYLVFGCVILKRIGFFGDRPTKEFELSKYL